jgi:peptidyl-prolyl cis-trans isomerase C
MKRMYTTLLLLSTIFLGATGAHAANLDPANKTVAATVDSTAITIGDVDEMILTNPQIQPALQQMTADEEKLNKLRHMVLDSLIDRQLMLQAAEKSSAVSEADAETKLKELIEQNGGEDKLKEFLKARKTDYSTFVTNMKQDILISEYIDKAVGNDVAVSEEDAKAVFEANPEQFSKPAQVHARHILIKSEADASADADAAAKKTITELHKKVTTGKADFAAVAQESSQCPSAAQGGDLGFFAKPQMVPPFADAAFAMKPGEISAPVKTQFGYHIIKVEETSAAEKATFASVRPMIEKQLTAQAKANAAREQIEKLRAASKIEVTLPKAS